MPGFSLSNYISLSGKRKTCGALSARQSFLRAPAVTVQRWKNVIFNTQLPSRCCPLDKTLWLLCAYRWVLPYNFVKFQHEANGMDTIFKEFLTYSLLVRSYGGWERKSSENIISIHLENLGKDVKPEILSHIINIGH